MTTHVYFKPTRNKVTQTNIRFIYINRRATDSKPPTASPDKDKNGQTGQYKVQRPHLAGHKRTKATLGRKILDKGKKLLPVKRSPLTDQSSRTRKLRMHLRDSSLPRRHQQTRSWPLQYREKPGQDAKTPGSSHRSEE